MQFRRDQVHELLDSVSGMAIVSPINVVYSAVEIEPANCDGLTSCDVESVKNASHIPITVPKSPSIGADLITELTQEMRCSRSAVTSRR